MEEINILNDISVNTNMQGINIDTKNADLEETKYEMGKKGLLEKGVTDNKGNPVILPNQLGDLKYIIQDIIAGDKKALERPEIKALNLDKIEKALKWLASANKIDDKMKWDLLKNGWKLSFRERPATAQEFLTQKFIGDQATTLHPWIKSTFIKYFDPLAPYRNLILSSCIGTGKNLPLDAKVYTDKDHYKLNKDIQVGDKVLSPDGTQTEVLATVDWEPMDMYEFEMDNGKKITSGLHHIHHVSYRKDENGNNIWDDVETEFILNHPDYDFEFMEVEVSENAEKVE